MSKRSLGLMVVVSAVVFMVGIGLSDFVSQASGQQVLPGGRPAKIHSYYAEGHDGVVIPAAEGTHGFMITDIVGVRGDEAGVTSPTSMYLRLGVDGPPLVRVSITGWLSPTPVTYHFESGIPVPPGAEVAYACGPEGSHGVNITICGYEF